MLAPINLCDMQGFPLGPARQVIVDPRNGLPFGKFAQQLHYRRDDVTFDGSQNAITIGGDPFESSIEFAVRSGTATRFIQQNELTISGRGYTLSYTPANNDIGIVTYWSQVPVSAATILGANDPYFSSVVSLLHMNGSNGGTAFTDQIAARTWTPSGATTSTTQKKYGTAAMSVTGVANTSQQYINSDTSSDFTFGSGNFTIEGYFYCTSLPASGITEYLFDQRPLGVNGAYVSLNFLNTAGTTNLVIIENNTNRIIGTTAISANTWNHFAYSRVGTTGYLFLNGNLEGTWADNTTYVGNFARWGGDSLVNSGNSSRPVIGYMDELRITRVGRYNVGFTPQLYEFQNA